VTDPLVGLLADLEEEAALARVRERLAGGEPAEAILDDCQEALVIVGERYRAGTYYIAGLIMAGEIFRETMEILEPLVEQPSEGPSAGRVLVCTVQGDIHDLGKNLLVMLLRSMRFEVEDLGVDVPPDDVVRAVLARPPDVLGLSGMLVSAFPTMRTTIEAVRAAAAPRGLRIPIVVGGGQMTAETASWVGADGWSVNAGEGADAIAALAAVARADRGDAVGGEAVGEPGH
jgi:5-methyltetrahydrofolate--homocysteine methyltransferase